MNRKKAILLSLSIGCIVVLGIGSCSLPRERLIREAPLIFVGEVVGYSTPSYQGGGFFATQQTVTYKVLRVLKGALDSLHVEVLYLSEGKQRRSFSSGEESVVFVTQDQTRRLIALRKYRRTRVIEAWIEARLWSKPTG